MMKARYRKGFERDVATAMKMGGSNVVAQKKRMTDKVIMTPRLTCQPVSTYCQLNQRITMKKHDVIDNEKLLHLVDELGMNQSEAAKKLGVSRQAISKHLRSLRSNTTKAVVLKRVDQVVDQKLDTIQQLTKINSYANELLDLCMRWQRGDKEALQILENQVKTVRVGGTKETVREFKFKDPRELALKAMAEVRSQLKLQLDIYQSLYDLNAAQEFQRSVLETIAEVSPDVRDEIIRRLNKERAIRSAVRFS